MKKNVEKILNVWEIVQTEVNRANIYEILVLPMIFWLFKKFVKVRQHYKNLHQPYLWKRFNYIFALLSNYPQVVIFRNGYMPLTELDAGTGSLSRACTCFLFSLLDMRLFIFKIMLHIYILYIYIIIYIYIYIYNSLIIHEKSCNETDQNTSREDPFILWYRSLRIHLICIYRPHVPYILKHVLW